MSGTVNCHMIVAGYYGFKLDIHVSVRPSVVSPSICSLFPDDNLSKHQWIITKFQEGQLSVSGERMCTILVNGLED